MPRVEIHIKKHVAQTIWADGSAIIVAELSDDDYDFLKKHFELIGRRIDPCWDHHAGVSFDFEPKNSPRPY